MNRSRRLALPVLCSLFIAIAGLAFGQTYTVLYNLTANSSDPFSPEWIGTFAQARDGNLYGTSQNGGTLSHGAVFRLTPSGTLTVLHSFDGTHGSVPRGGLTLGTDGALYGTTCTGGANNLGTVFKITTGGTFTVLHNFNTSNGDGYCPEAAPIQGTDGNFYGTTTQATNKVGSVYKMTPAGALTTLYIFDDPHGETPLAMILGKDGNFYGTTRYGGSTNKGTVFKITNAGTFTLLHSFDGTDGNDPIGPIAQGTDGNLYGWTNQGSKIYKMTTAGVLSTISTLDATTGNQPIAGLILASNGKLYGPTFARAANGGGAILQISTSGAVSVLHDFSLADGYFPEVSVFQHTNGGLYGNTGTGGTSAKPAGTLYKFNAGIAPFASLVPSRGKVGKSIGILGQGFIGTTKVTFNGTNASFSVVSDTYLTATIPAGVKTGTVTVVTGKGTLKSSRPFLVTPQLTQFAPSSGAAGTVVTLTGVSLDQASKVTFGGVKAATFVVNSDTQVNATVPAGAKTGVIAVTTPGGTASSTAKFTVTP